MLQKIFEYLSRIAYELGTDSAEKIALANCFHPFNHVHIHAEQFPAEQKPVPFPEGLHELLAERVGPFAAVVVACAHFCVLQTNDHQPAGHGPAGLAGTGKSRAECAGDAQRCLAIQTGPFSIGRKDRLGSAETIKKCCERFVDILAHRNC